MAVIKKPTKVLQGQVNMAAHAEHSKPIVGGETDSVKITVKDNVITGDVKWKSQLGYTADKAYPGNDGSKNRASIEELVHELQDVSEQLNNIKSTLSRQIADTETNVYNVDKRLEKVEDKVQHESTEALLVKIATETTRALAAEKELTIQIVNEVTAREDVDESIKKELTDIEKSFSEQVDNLVYDINKKIKVITDSQFRTEQKIATEKDRAISSEASLRKTLTDNQTAHEVELKGIKDALEQAQEQSSTRFQELQDIFNNALGEVDTLINSLETQLVTVTEQYQDVLSQVTIVNDKFDEISDKYLHLLHYYEQLKEDVETKNKQLDAKIDIVDNSIKDEITRSTAVDNDLTERVETLETTSSENIKSIESKIETIETTVTKQTHDLHYLQQDVDNVKETIKDFDDITADVNQLKTTTAETEAKLNNSIEETNNKFTELENKVVQLDGAVKIVPNEGNEQVYGQTGEDVVLHELTNEVKANAVVKRDENGNINVPENDLTSSSAVPKSIMDNAIDNLNATLTANMERAIKNAIESMQFDFIDGGTAPIDK